VLLGFDETARAVSADGCMVVTGGDAAPLRVRDRSQTVPVPTSLDERANLADVLVVSRNRRVLLVASDDGSLFTHNLDTNDTSELPSTGEFVFAQVET
jgi:hypothetical protein